MGDLENYNFQALHGSVDFPQASFTKNGLPCFLMFSQSPLSLPSKSSSIGLSVRLGIASLNVSSSTC